MCRKETGIRYELCRYGCMKNFIFDVFSEKELQHYYTPMEYLIVKEFARREEKNVTTKLALF